MSYQIKINELKMLMSRMEACIDLSSTLISQRSANSTIAASETVKEARHLVAFMTPVMTALERVCQAQEQQTNSLKAALASATMSRRTCSTRPICFINRHCNM